MKPQLKTPVFPDTIWRAPNSVICKEIWRAYQVRCKESNNTKKLISRQKHENCMYQILTFC